jgi:hypothetical protein
MVAPLSDSGGKAKSVACYEADSLTTSGSRRFGGSGTDDSLTIAENRWFGCAPTFRGVCCVRYITNRVLYRYMQILDGFVILSTVPVPPKTLDTTHDVVASRLNAYRAPTVLLLEDD